MLQPTLFTPNTLGTDVIAYSPSEYIYKPSGSMN